MRSRSFRKWGVVLGMIAILMATLAPTISQALVSVRSHTTQAHDHCAMHASADMSSMSMSMDPMHASMMQWDVSGGTSTHGSGMMHGDHHAMSPGDACGYCSLLAHLPVVPVVHSPFAVTVRAIQHRVATRFESVRRADPLTFAQPRAPPVLS